MFSKNLPIYCIVCGKESFLGLRQPKMHFIGSCKDCKREYYYPANSTVPTKNRTIRDKNNTCSCGGCSGDDPNWWLA